MRVLAIDIGSSSVKAAVLIGPRRQAAVGRVGFETVYSDGRAEVPVRNVERAVADAIKQLGKVGNIDLIIPTGMAPSWLAMDARGRALTPIVTHQDRRSADEAHEIERLVGKSRHVRIAGNRPVPGGISSSTCRWFSRHERALMKRVDLVGHLNTWLIRTWCGPDARVVDPSNASFTGMYETTTLGGWNEELIDAAGAKRAWVPRVIDGNQVAGHLSAAGARQLGAHEGTPVLAGVIDGSGAMLMAGSKVGQMVNVVGSTDVLAVCVDRPKPDLDMLTRGVGVGRRWLHVITLAAAGTAVDWVQRTFFADLSTEQFWKLVAMTLKNERRDQRPSPKFDATLAGSRSSLEVVTASITGLTLGTSREDILAALLDDLSRRGAARVDRLTKVTRQINHTVLSTGGGDGTLAAIMRRDWRGRWTFRHEEEATLAGMWVLAESAHVD